MTELNSQIIEGNSFYFSSFITQKNMKDVFVPFSIQVGMAQRENATFHFKTNNNEKNETLIYC